VSSWETQGLVVTSGIFGRRLHYADAIQATDHCLDRLGADLAAEEKRLGTECALLAKAWAHFCEVVENGRKAEKAARLHPEKAHEDVQEIRRGTGERRRQPL
jgi:hypothetical protein